LFIVRPFFYNTMYSFWYTTSYNFASFMMPMWSYHWWFGYPFVTLPMQEWMHCNPWYVSKYHHTYPIREWNSCTNRGLSAFSPPHMKMSGYCHHQKWFSNLGGHFHYQSNSYKFGVVCFDNNNACSDNCRSRQGIILHRASSRRWFHSPCHRDLRLFPSLFWFFFCFLCTSLYNLPSVDLLGTFDDYIPL